MITNWEITFLICAVFFHLTITNVILFQILRRTIEINFWTKETAKSSIGIECIERHKMGIVSRKE